MITCFVGSWNRITTLERTVLSYRRFKTPYEIVIVDNGSDHPDCLAMLERLAEFPEVREVYRLPVCDSMEEAQGNFCEAMRRVHESKDGGGEWYAVTEADVCFDGTHRDALDAYIELANHSGRPVGPHLRVDPDIPAHYPLRSRVLACETWMQYRRDMIWHEGIPYNSTQIDTTFHLFPRAPSFDRLHMDPFRVGPPYDAMHLDWYLNVFDPVPENAIYIAGERQIGSWGKAWIRDYWNWYQRHGAEGAFKRLKFAPRNTHGDLCNISFIRSFCHQYGVGTEIDMEQSRFWLSAAIPTRYARYWDLEQDWMASIYLNDHSALGWDTPEEAAA